MANLCSTGITFYSEDKKVLKDFKRRIAKINNGNSTHENDFGSCWLGNIANKFYPEIGAEKINCRGSIVHLDDTIRQTESFFSFSICTQTAWDAKIGLWAKIVRDFYPEIKIAYVAEECGCEYFAKWDDEGLFYPFEYYFDICYSDADGEEEYADDHNFNTVQEISDWLEAHLPFKFEKKANAGELENEINSKLNELEDSDGFFCTIAKYTEVNPDDFSFYK